MARRALLGAAIAVLVLAGSTAHAEAAPSLAWTTPAPFDAGGGPRALSCPSESLCVAVDGEGDALVTLDPTASSRSWSSNAIDRGGRPLNAVSCVPSGPCVAVDGLGNAFVSSQPGSSSWSSTSIAGGRALTGVSCPAASLCVAVDEAGELLASGSPGSGGWSIASIDVEHHLRAVSCSSPSLCVAVDDAGNVLWSVNPGGGAGAWHRQRVDFGELTAVSCSPSGPCVATDALGNALASADPSAQPATWSLTPIDGERLTAVSCSSAGLCVAVDSRGAAFASDAPVATSPGWSGSNIDSSALTGVSCLPGGFCTAVDAGGRSLATRVPAPETTTLAVTEVTSAGATLAGAVNPNDAVLGACSFEYGTTVAYTQTIPCSTLPTASGGRQTVSAVVSGLLANTAYHYRLLASSAAGASAGGDATFTTAVSSQISLVYPHPSVSGTPAPGQRLTCHPGISSGSSAVVVFAWLRDLIPIPGSTGTTYTIRNQDSGHHLQCQVTATTGGGSVTARSGFATVPAGGAPSSSGETIVGRAVVRGGRVSLPVLCSAHASGGCAIALRLAVVETLNGSRIVAVSARAVRGAHRSALRRRTVTLASARTHLAAGAHGTISAPLNGAARALLASGRRFSAYLYVSGTVIGVLQSQLAQQLLTLVPSARGATHATRRR